MYTRNCTSAAPFVAGDLFADWKEFMLVLLFAVLLVVQTETQGLVLYRLPPVGGFASYEKDLPKELKYIEQDF